MKKPITALNDLMSYSFIEDLIKIIMVGEFVAPELAPVTGEGIENFGPMNTPEKAFFTLHKQYQADWELIETTLHGNEIFPPETRAVMMGKCNALLHKIETAIGHLWESINERFEKEYSEIAAGKDGEIVSSIHSDFSITAKILSPEESLDIAATLCNDPNCLVHGKQNKQ